MAHNHSEHLMNCDKSLLMTTKPPGPTNGHAGEQLHPHPPGSVRPTDSLNDLHYILLRKANTHRILSEGLKGFDHKQNVTYGVDILYCKDTPTVFRNNEKGKARRLS